MTYGVDRGNSTATGTAATEDHGELVGLADDDHTQYAKADGTRWTTTQTALKVVVSDASGNLVASAAAADGVLMLTPASASAPASIALAEDTDNGAHTATITAPSSLAANRTATLPDSDLTFAGTNVKQSFTKQQTPLKAALTHASPTTWDCDAAQVATWTITASVTLSAATNQVAGTFYTLVVTQDGTGGWAITFDSTYKFADGIDEEISTGASSVSILTFYSDGTNMYCVGAAKNLS